MKIKSLSILLSFMVLFQSLGLHASDLFRLDDMRRHLATHEQDFGDSFISFLDKHYGMQKALHDKEENHGSKDHNQLPFKHKMCKVSASVEVVMPKILVLDCLTPKMAREIPQFVQSHYSFLNQFDIFQPPRSV